jgi:predicted phage terminase large subunit-like protein
MKTVSQFIQAFKTAIDTINPKYDITFWEFINKYLKHHFQLPFNQFHREFISDLEASQGNLRIVRIAPRGHAKTTLAIYYMLYCLAIKKKEFIVIIGSNSEQAAMKTQELQVEIMSNDDLQKDFPHLQPKMKRNINQIVKFTNSHMIFKNDSVIIGKGMNAAIRGIKYKNKRPDMILIDDPEKDSDVESATSREKIKKYFNSTVSFLKGAGRSCDIILVDTLKHYDSLIFHISQKPDWNSKRYSAVVSEENKTVLWPDVFCYDVSQLSIWEIENYEKRGTTGYELIREPFYGVLKNNDGTPKITGLAHDPEKAESFTQEYLSMPGTQEEHSMRRSLWKYFDVNKSGLGEFLSSKTVTVGALDISVSKTNTSDYQGISIVSFDRYTQRYYLLDGFLKRTNLISEQGQESLSGLIVDLIRKYKLDYFYIEANNSQILFKTTLQKQLQKQGVICQIIGIHSKENKVERIRNVFGLICQAGLFYVRSDLENDPEGQKFMRQIEYFPKADHDDAPDTVNMAIDQIKKVYMQWIEEEK